MNPLITSTDTAKTPPTQMYYETNNVSLQMQVDATNDATSHVFATQQLPNNNRDGSHTIQTHRVQKEQIENSNFEEEEEIEKKPTQPIKQETKKSTQVGQLTDAMQQLNIEEKIEYSDFEKSKKSNIRENKRRKTTATRENIFTDPMQQIFNINRPRKIFEQLYHLMITDTHYIETKKNLPKTDNFKRFKKFLLSPSFKSSVFELSDSEGYTLLHKASLMNKLPYVSLLIEQGMDIEVKTPNQLTPLGVAIQAGHISIAKFLIANQAKINSKDATGSTPMHLAAQYGQSSILLLMIDVCREYQQQESSHNNILGKPSVCELLNMQNSWGQTPLHYAVLHQRINCATQLIANGVDINTEDAIGMTPWLSAVSVDSLKCMYILIKNGARLNPTNKEGDNAIHIAIKKYSNLELTNFLNILLEKQVLTEMINQENNLGMTPYLLTSDREKRKILIGYGAKITSIDKSKVICKICNEIFFNALSFACGHSYCRLCFHTWQVMQAKISPSLHCHTCESKMRLVQSYYPNDQLNQILKKDFPIEFAKQEEKEKADPVGRMLRNVQVLATYLRNPTLNFLKPDNTLTLNINNEFNLHIIYREQEDIIYLKTPIKSAYTGSLNTVIMLQYNHLVSDELSAEEIWKEAIICCTQISMKNAPDDALKNAYESFVKQAKKYRDMIM